MPKQRLLTLKEAADALGIDEKAVQAQLVAGQLKGEKKSAWLQDKWFVYQGDVDELLAKQITEPEAPKSGKAAAKPTPVSEHAITVDLKAVMGPNRHLSAQPSTKTSGEDEVRIWLATERERLKLIVEQVMQPLVEKIATQAQALAEKDRIIEEQAKQLKMLPDLEKQASESRAAKESEMAELKDKIAILKEHNKQGDLALVKVAELETTLQDLKRLEAADKAAAESQIEKLKKEREQQAQALDDEIAFLSSQLELAQRPWWRKLIKRSNHGE
jgi:hypothetical protein